MRQRGMYEQNFQIEQNFHQRLRQVYRLRQHQQAQRLRQHQAQLSAQWYKKSEDVLAFLIRLRRHRGKPP